jgi:hypothetical protein
MRHVSHYARPNVLVPKLSSPTPDGLLKPSYRSTRLLIGVSVFFLYAVTISLTEARVVTYNFCVQDNSSGYSLQVNSATGDYKFKRCSDGLTVTGIGTITVQGSTYRLNHNPSDRRVTAIWSTATNNGTASLQLPPGTTIITISDSNLTNNNCGT